MKSLLLALLCAAAMPTVASRQREEPRERWTSAAVEVKKSRRLARELGKRASGVGYITSSLCSDESCYIAHKSNSSTLSLAEAKAFCEQKLAGPGHLAWVLDEQDAAMLKKLIISSAATPFARDGELWTDLWRGRAGCEDPTGPLRGFTWKAAGRALAAAGAVQTSPGKVTWSEHHQLLWDCAQEQCATLVVVDGASGVAEWRQRYCSDQTAVTGVVCRVSCADAPLVCPRGPRPNPPAADPNTRPQRGAPTCAPGFAWDEDAGECEDVDECDDFSVCVNGLCDNTEGGFVCDCLRGYARVDGTVCADIDECADNADACSPFRCLNTGGSYQCDCPAGYAQDKSGLVCDDVDECSASGGGGGGGGGCRHGCVNTRGSYRCTCPAGQSLAEDGRRCAPLDASVPPGTEATGRNLLVWIVVSALAIVACAVAAAAVCRRRRRRRRRGQGVSALGDAASQSAAQQQQQRGGNSANGEDAWLDSRP